MYIKAASRRNIGFWVKHLQDQKNNDRAEMIDARGLASSELRGMLLEMQQDAEFTRCKNFMHIAIFNPTETERLTPQQWERAYEIYEKERGIPEGQQRIVIEHEKKGRVHHHVIWNRIDTENVRAFPDGYNLEVCTAAEHRIEHELGLEKTPSYFNRDAELPALERSPKSWEMFRQQKGGLDPRQVTAEVTALYQASEDGPDFAAKLEESGYRLCQGDRRNFVILDPRGDDHSLARRVSGVKAKELSAFMAGVERETLPTVDQAREDHRRELIALSRDELAQVQHEIEREELRPSMEPETWRGRKLDGEVPAPAGPAPAMLNDTQSAIWIASHSSDSARSFAAALLEQGIVLARTSAEEAAESQRLSDFAREIGRFSPAHREGEIVALNEEGHVYRLSERSTGTSFNDMQAFLRVLDPDELHSIKQTIQEQEHDDRQRRRAEHALFRGLYDHSGAENEDLRQTILDRAERMTIENERAEHRPRNTRDS